jgi:glycosyltransferase involved in cell wall biosynthesis
MTMPHLVANVQAVLTARSRLNFSLVMVPLLHENDPRWNISQMAAALTRADAVVALTSHEVDRLSASYGVPRRKIFLAPEGIDLPPTAPVQAERRKRIVFIGRQAKSKGILDLIEAMRLVWPNHPDAELVIAGARVPESAEIDARIGALSAFDRGRIVHLGQVSEEEKEDLLRSARCAVLPSKIESFCFLALEAWAHARPVVTWDLPVSRSTVDDGLNGLLADPRRASPALAEALLRILENPNEADRMGMSGYEAAKSQYSWASVASVYLDAYRHAIQNAQPR